MPGWFLGLLMVCGVVLMALYPEPRATIGALLVAGILYRRAPARITQGVHNIRALAVRAWRSITRK